MQIHFEHDEVGARVDHLVRDAVLRGQGDARPRKSVKNFIAAALPPRAPSARSIVCGTSG